MDKVEEARKFLELVGMPKAQQSDICCYVLLAMADIKPDMSWNEAKNDWIRIHDIIQFSNAFYDTTYAENSRETKMAKPKIFVSFDFENDRNYKYTLNMWNANSSFEFTSNDKSPSKIQSWNISTVKSVLSRKINEATHVVVIVGKEANKLHKDRAHIGYQNWGNFEVVKAKELRKHIIAVQLNSVYEYLEELKNCGAAWVYSFNHDYIMRAVGG